MAIRPEGALSRVYNSPAWKAYAQANHFESVWMGSADFTRYLVGRRVEMEEFLRAIGAMPKS